MSKQDIEELVARKVRSWFGEPVIAVEEEITKLISNQVRADIEKAIRLTWNKSGEGYNGEYPIEDKDGTVIEEVIVKEVLAELNKELK